MNEIYVEQFKHVLDKIEQELYTVVRENFPSPLLERGKDLNVKVVSLVVNQFVADMHDFIDHNVEELAQQEISDVELNNLSVNVIRKISLEFNKVMTGPMVDKLLASETREEIRKTVTEKMLDHFFINYRNLSLAN